MAIRVRNLMSMFHRGSSWFEKLVGFDENGFNPKIDPPQLSIIDDPNCVGNKLLYSNVNKKSYRIGNFETPSLGELRDRALQSKPKLADNTKASSGLKISHVCTGDIFPHHFKKENESAMMQAASQFNCLEFASPDVTPEHGVTEYEYDRTQGPACSLAAAPATIYRNYFVPLNGKIGQETNNQINNLDEVLKHLDATDIVTVRNGYTQVYGGDVDIRLNKMNLSIKACENRQALLDKLRIGIHSQVEVPWEKKWNLNSQKSSTVSQAFCSALSIGYAYGSSSSWAPLAQVVLDATYEATLWAAAAEYANGIGSGKVMLTFIGGGVFGNDMDWIAKAIGRACALVDKAGFPLDVVVCHYSDSGGVQSSIERNVQAAYDEFKI